MTVEFGTASASPGERARGYWDATTLPTGTPERLPVVVVNGSEAGPTAWLTAGVHGDEVTGVAAAQDACAALDPDSLVGCVVCLPCVNPAGLRQTERTSYYHGDDPNRHFPDPASDSSRPPRVQERIAWRLYEAFVGKGEAPRADLLVDLHTAQVGSMPFTIRDRVLYGSQRDEEAAHALADDLERLADAITLPVVTEFEAVEYTERNLQRSLAGSALNAAGIPACTVELGSRSVVEEGNRAAGVAGVCRALVAFEMLESVPEKVETAAPDVEAPVDYPVRRYVGPHAETVGIARHRVAAGDVVESGTVVADVVAPTGEHRASVTVDREGYVLARQGGVAVYENDPLASLAVRDEGELVVSRSGRE
ncbi:succinylglutamate desuccinylase/aspartoacylase family protein [Halomarina litorea]|uniref:succinylglutamate desuccinylase/aspartoacylase family protein n=1 Tax=Halomarina litorea TaxID=2961595 RepID=UPI0020C3D93A|nr:succinylglutamate desuccinylase/aspartoacylase family protein [Halomarina sp. BCD28]